MRLFCHCKGRGMPLLYIFILKKMKKVVDLTSIFGYNTLA